MIPGASGVLGTAVYEAFKQTGYDVLGTAYTRAQERPDLHFLNILDDSALEQTVRSFKPHWLIHTAAERRPDVAERDPDSTIKVSRRPGVVFQRYTTNCLFVILAKRWRNFTFRTTCRPIFF